MGCCVNKSPSDGFLFPAPSLFLCLQSLSLVSLLCLYNNIIESCFPPLLLPGSPDSSQNHQLGIVFKNLSAWKMSHSTGSRITKPWIAKDLSNFSLRSLLPSIIQVPTCPLCDHNGTRESWKTLVSCTAENFVIWTSSSNFYAQADHVSVFSHSFILTRARKILLTNIRILIPVLIMTSSWLPLTSNDCSRKKPQK